MADHKSIWLEQSEAMLEALRANQASLHDRWGDFLGELRAGWGGADRDSDARGEGAGEEGAPVEARLALHRAVEELATGPIAWQIDATRRTVEALGEFAKRFLAGGDAGALDAISLWRRSGEALLGASLPPPVRAGEAPASIDDFLRQLAEPWSSAAQGWQPGLAWLRDQMARWHHHVDAPGAVRSIDAWDRLSSLVGTMARHPSLGPIEPEIAQRSTEAVEAWLACMSAVQRYETLRLQTWTRIGERFVDSLTEGEGSRERVGSLRELLQRWVDVGDGILMEMYRSDDYLAAQRELLESLMRYRVKLQAVQEVIAREAGLPTRGELDDAHRSIHLLRREVRELKRASRTSSRPNGSVGGELTADAAARDTDGGSRGSASRKTSSKRTSSKKTSSKRASAKKTSASASSTKKASAKKAPAKKAPGKKARSKKTSST